MRRMQDELRDAAIRERKEKAKLQKEVEALSRQLAEGEQSRKHELLNAQGEVERVLREARIA